MKNFLLILFYLSLSQSVFAKRMAPKKIEDIPTKRGVIHYEFHRTSRGFTSYVLMKDKAGDMRWKTKIFSRKYTENLETDVQDIFLKSLKVLDMSVVAVDERGRTYEIDLDDGKLLKPQRPVNY